QVQHRVFDEVGIAVVGETLGELFEETELGFDLAQEQSAGIGGDMSAVETRDDGTGTEVLEDEFVGGTLCHSKVASGFGVKSLSLLSLCHPRAPCAIALVRNSG